MKTKKINGVKTKKIIGWIAWNETIVDMLVGDVSDILITASRHRSKERTYVSTKLKPKKVTITIEVEE